LKEWIDSTLTLGWAFGENATVLSGKTWVHAISTGGDEKSYSDPNYMTIGQLLLPLERTASLCKMRWQSPFVLFDADQQTPDQLRAQSRDYLIWLNALGKPPNSVTSQLTTQTTY
jgi:glutathione-regulated potassium-efflux system ancillary protein KefG